jgi:hypothetical protein
VRRWAVPAAAAAAVAALAIGVSQYPGTGMLAEGLKAQTGIVNLAPDQNTASKTPPPAQQVAVNPPAKDNSGGTNVTPLPNNKDVGPVTPPPPAPVGKTDANGGSGAATPTGDVPPKVTLAPQMAYSFTVAVTGVLDQKAEALLADVSSLREKVNNDTMRIFVPPTQEQMDKTQKRLTELFPGAVIKASSQNLAGDISEAEQKLNDANQALEGDKVLSAPDAKLAEDQKKIQDAEEYLKLLKGQVSSAAFTIQFQPAH